MAVFRKKGSKCPPAKYFIILILKTEETLNINRTLILVLKDMKTLPYKRKRVLPRPPVLEPTNQQRSPASALAQKYELRLSTLHQSTFNRLSDLLEILNTHLNETLRKKCSIRRKPTTTQTMAAKA